MLNNAHVKSTLNLSLKIGWKWSNGAGKSEIIIILCIYVSQTM